MLCAEHLQERLGADDAQAAVFVEIEQIAITAREVVRRAGDCVLEIDYRPGRRRRRSA
jgi:hypothetical protein